MARCSDAIAEAAGAAPLGFRAPGYTINDALFEVLAELGMRYDSSVFPCPAYYAAKVAAISGYRLLGRRSHSIDRSPARAQRARRAVPRRHALLAPRRAHAGAADRRDA